MVVCSPQVTGVCKLVSRNSYKYFMLKSSSLSLGSKRLTECNRTHITTNTND